MQYMTLQYNYSKVSFCWFWYISSKEPLQRVCGAFLACLEVLKQRAPQSFLTSASKKSKQRILDSKSVSPTMDNLKSVHWHHYKRTYVSKSKWVNFDTEVSLQARRRWFDTAASNFCATVWHWQCKGLCFPSVQLCSKGHHFSLNTSN